MLVMSGTDSSMETTDSFTEILPDGTSSSVTVSILCSSGISSGFLNRGMAEGVGFLLSDASTLLLRLSILSTTSTISPCSLPNVVFSSCKSAFTLSMSLFSGPTIVQWQYLGIG